MQQQGAAECWMQVPRRVKYLVIQPEAARRVEVLRVPRGCWESQEELGPRSSHRPCQACSSTSLLLPLHPNVWQGDGTQMDLSGLNASQQPGTSCFAPLTCELLFCSSLTLGKWIGSVLPIPAAPGSARRSSLAVRTGTICCPSGPAWQKGSVRLRFCISRGCRCSGVPCKLWGGPGSSVCCRLVWKEALTSAQPSGLVTGRTAPVGAPKHHRPLPAKGSLVPVACFQMAARAATPVGLEFASLLLSYCCAAFASAGGSLQLARRISHFTKELFCQHTFSAES